MQIDFTLIVLITGTVIAQGVFAALVLGFARTNRLPNLFLGLLLLSMSLWLIDTFYNVAGIYRRNPDFYFQPIYYSLAFGPLIYFYVKSLTNRSFQFKRGYLLHFIPVFIQAALYWFLHFQEYAYKRWYWLEIHRPITYNLEFDATLVSLSIYLALSVRLLIKYQRWLENNFSEFSKIRLNWLRTLLSTMLILCGFWLIDVILHDFFHYYQAHNYSEISLGLITLILAFGGIRQNSTGPVSFQPAQTTHEHTHEKLDKDLIRRITQRMEEEKDYLNPTLTLSEFAEALDIPSRAVSRHINQGLGVSFVDFVNRYRVDEVRKKMASGDLKQFTLLTLAFESGFNSKSTFNRIFKKFTGVSPSEYLKRSQPGN